MRFKVEYEPMKPSPRVGVFQGLYSASLHPYPNLPAPSAHAGLQTHRIPYWWRVQVNLSKYGLPLFVTLIIWWVDDSAFLFSLCLLLVFLGHGTGFLLSSLAGVSRMGRGLFFWRREGGWVSTAVFYFPIWLIITCFRFWIFGLDF